MNEREKPDSTGEQFIQLLRNAGIKADYRRLEEILWLSRLMPVAETGESEPDTPPDESGKEQEHTGKTTSSAGKQLKTGKDAPPPARARKPAESKEQVYSNLGTSGDEGTLASKVRVPSPAALPDSLEMMRALRPFRRRVLSRQRFELDEEETVTRTAERGFLTPAYLPVRERWFDAALVVEDKPSMAIWSQPLAEFRRVLERLSAFREIRTLRLAVADDKACLLTPAGQDSAGQEQPLTTISDPYGRRLILLFTDGVSAAWQDGRMAKALAVWGRTQPVVIVQVLSERMWHLTPLGKPSAQVNAHTPGAANRNLEVLRLWESEESPLELPLPVVVLHPDSLGRWAQAVLTGTVQTPAVVLHETGDDAVDASELEASLQDLSAEELVARFQYLASPTAFQLAVYLSSVPLQIPIMRLVQRVMLPESGLEHLSEFLLGGLVERKTGETAAGIEEVEFIFRKDSQGNSVKMLLEREIRKGEMQRLYRSVAQYIEERYGQPFDFFALVADQKGSLRVPAEALPFTEAAQTLLRRFGITPRDGRRFNLPDPAEDTSDLEQYLALMEDEFAHGQRIFYVAGEAGSGKTELALSFAQRVKRHFPTAHYFLDLSSSRGVHPANLLTEDGEPITEDGEPMIGGGQVTTETVMSTIIRAFQPNEILPNSNSELLELYRNVLQQERALLLLDDIGAQVELEPLLAHETSIYLFTSRHPRTISDFKCITVNMPDPDGKPVDVPPTFEELENFVTMQLAAAGLNETRFQARFSELQRLKQELAQTRFFDRKLRKDLQAQIETAEKELSKLADSIVEQYLLAVERLDEQIDLHENALGVAEAQHLFSRIIDAKGETERALAMARKSLTVYESLGETAKAEKLRVLTQKWEAALNIPKLTPFTFETVTLDALGKVTERRRLQANQFIEELAPGVTLEMVEIPGGNFLMGSNERDSEKPPHKVTVPAFYMGKFQVTQAQWRVVAGWPKVKLELKPEPSYFPQSKGREKNDDDRPVEQVSWEEAVEFCARVSAKTGRDYRLPSEAEWEYACRAGTTTPFAFGETITPEFVNYDGNYPYGEAPKGEFREETVPVGSLGATKKDELNVANAFGLYDMHGNVWEWCEDVWHDNYQKAPDDGSAWLSGGDSGFRVVRGGSWDFSGYGCRSAYRYGDRPGYLNVVIGFRVVVSAGLDNTRPLNA